MRKRTLTSSASALLLLLASSLVSAKHATHDHLNALHKRHRATREVGARSTAEDGDLGIEIRAIPETTAPSVEKRAGQCAFPYDAGLVPVTPGQQNAGWAMSPDQPPKPGNYLPYACPPGQVSMQWDPSATSYTYPKSMNGGLFCGEDGNVQKPFPNKPYCQSTATNIGVVNKAGGVVSFCQTVLPGNEAMLIPTSVTDYATLAVPDPSYWCSTAAHYYINPPGIGAGEGCVWGTSSKPHGNWTPYVAGANVDASGETFIKLGWNPIYLEPATPFRNERPNWGVRVECPNGGCNGLPCAIDPSQNSVNQMLGSASNGAGGGAFCVVTVSKGATANFVVFKTGGDSGGTGWSPSGGQGAQFYQSSSGAAPTSSAQPTTSSSDSTSSAAATTAWPSSSTQSSTFSWGGWDNDTSTGYTSSQVPRQSQYYSLFDYSTAADATETSAPTTAVDAQPTTEATTTGVQPALKTALGGAPLNKASTLALVSGLAFSIILSL